MWLQFTLLGALLQVLPSGGPQNFLRNAFDQFFILQIPKTFSVESSRFRIIAGRRASTIEFPYQAELEKMERHWCGGSIIHRRFILTAAHCVKEHESNTSVPTSVLRVRVGNDQVQSGGTVYAISAVIPHENYNEYSDMDQYDIALLMLTTPLKLSDRVSIISLAKKQPQPGDLGWVTGYGKQQMMRSDMSEKRHLMAVELPVVSLEKCRRILRGVASDMICAGFKKGHRDSCTGDSGGPYAVNNQLAGIVAWGIGCGREGLPGVYTNVAIYRDWVNDKMKGYNGGDPDNNPDYDYLIPL